MNQYEHEEEQLERDLVEGSITLAEYNKQLRELQRAARDDVRGAAEEASERAYRDELDRW